MNLLCEASGENHASYSPSHFIQVNLFPGERSSLALSHFEVHLVEFPSSALAPPPLQTSSCFLLLSVNGSALAMMGRGVAFFL